MPARLVALPLLLALSVACVPKEVSLDASVDPAVAVENIDENLARLNALEVVVVEANRTLLGTTGNCYTLPCNDAEAVQIEAERAEAAVALAELTALAERVATERIDAARFDRDAVDADLAALRALEVVSVTAFVEAEPALTGNCYGPCEREVAEAEAINAERAAILRAIVAEVAN